METKQLIVKSVLDAWTSRLASTNKLLDSFSDNDLQKEVAPGRNRGLYLMGHLTAVHDKMLPLLGFEQQAYPHLENIFLTQPDRSVAEIPSTEEIRASWTGVNSRLDAHFNRLSPDEWFHRHTAVSEEDFVKEPHRNRLNVLIGRTNHLQYHMGQLALIRK